MTTSFTIGKLAEQAQVNIQTIRYYERRLLLPSPERSASNYRVYSEDALRRIRFIKRAQGLGFTLSEIRELLELRASRQSCCEDVRERSLAKIQDMEQKVRSLQAMTKALTKLTGECSGIGPASDCPILESMDGERGTGPQQVLPSAGDRS